MHGGNDDGEQHRGPLLQAVRPRGLSRSIILFPWAGLPFLQPVSCRVRQIFVVYGFFSVPWLHGLALALLLGSRS